VCVRFSLGLQLSASHSLKRIDLSNNSLNDSGCLSLSQALPFLPGLVSLNLSYNLLGIKGVYPLLAALPFMKIEVNNERSGLFLCYC
jgi:Ran GTPase-activating protein (RanGAP) involved in mRNA processing and transport